MRAFVGKLPEFLLFESILCIQANICSYWYVLNELAEEKFYQGNGLKRMIKRYLFKNSSVFSVLSYLQGLIEPGVLVRLYGHQLVTFPGNLHEHSILFTNGLSGTTYPGGSYFIMTNMESVATDFRRNNRVF